MKTRSLLLFSCLVVLIGCVNKRLPDFCPGSIPQPVGTYVRDWNCSQKQKASNDVGAIHLCDWSNEQARESELAPAAKQRLMRYSEQYTSYDLSIVASGDEALDARRQNYLVEYLAGMGQFIDSIPIVGDPGYHLRGPETVTMSSARSGIEQQMDQIRLQPYNSSSFGGGGGNRGGGTGGLGGGALGGF